MEVLVSNSELDTENIGRKIARLCHNPDFVALFGDMGSGKTVFMRGFAGELVPGALVSSPTYAILNVYENGGVQVNHFDMYRISGEEDLLSTGYEEVLSQGITVCEWSENIVDFLPDKYWKITFFKTSDTQRKLQLERIGE